MAIKAPKWTASVLLGLVLVAAGIYYFAVYGLPFATDVAVGGATLVEPDRLWIWLGCGDPASASATATEDESTVTIHAQLQTRQGDCATSTEVQLDGPLGERRLIDGYDGTEISVDG